jgi:hypothetical protein
MPRRTDDAELSASGEEIRRLANKIEFEREYRRQLEREEEEWRAELRRIKTLEQEIQDLEKELGHQPDVQNYPNQGAERQHNDWQQHHGRQQHNSQQQHNDWQQHNGWQQHNDWQQRNSWNGSPYYGNYYYYPPWFDHRGMIGLAYNRPITPTPYSAGWPSSGSSGAVETRSPYQDEHFRRVRGERVLQQERAMANARDRAVDLQRAINNNVATVPGGLHRRNTLSGGGRQREMAHRRSMPHYPPWFL